MSINYQIHNILHTVSHKRGNPINIFYTYNNTLFDKVIDQISDAVALNNQVFLNSPLSYGLCIINDPLDMAQNINAYNNLYANKILFFHENPPSGLKKEDLFLLRHTLSKFSCYSFCNNYESWSNPKMRYMSYGIKYQDNNINKNKNIIMLSYNNNKQTKLIYDNLKNIYHDTYLLEIDYSKSYDNILQIISEYKICIDLASYYNVLCAASVGCYGITSKKSHSDEFIYQITDYQQMLAIIKDILHMPATNINNIQEYIKHTYPYEPFIENIKNIITDYSMKAVIL